MVVIGESVTRGITTYLILKGETLQVIEVSEEFISNIVKSGFNLILNSSILKEPKKERYKYIAYIVDGEVYNDKCVLGVVGNVIVGVDYTGKIGVMPYSENLRDIDKSKFVLTYMNVRYIVNILSKCKRTSLIDTGKYTGKFISEDTLKPICYRSPNSRHMEIRASISGRLVTINAYALDDTNTCLIKKQFGVLHNNGVPFAGLYSYTNHNISKKDFIELVCLKRNSAQLLGHIRSKNFSIRDKVCNNDTSIVDNQLAQLALKFIYRRDIQYFSMLEDYESILLTRVITQSGIKYKFIEHLSGTGGTCVVKTESIENIYKNSKQYANVKVQSNIITIYGLDGVYEYDIDKVYAEYKTQILQPSQIAIGQRMLGKNYIENINERGELLKISSDTSVLRLANTCTSILKDSITISNNNVMLVIPSTVRKISKRAISNYKLFKPLIIRIEKTGLLETVYSNIATYRDIKIQVVGLNKRDMKIISKFMVQAVKYNYSLELVDGSEPITHTDIISILKAISVDNLNSFDIFNMYERNSVSSNSLENYINKWNKYKLFIYNSMYNMTDTKGKIVIEKFISSIDNKHLQMNIH